ncbi:hypothetical protein GCM10027440_51200 [Nocardiopsis coralliicola]
MHGRRAANALPLCGGSNARFLPERGAQSRTVWSNVGVDSIELGGFAQRAFALACRPCPQGRRPARGCCPMSLSA